MHFTIVNRLKNNSQKCIAKICNLCYNNFKIVKHTSIISLIALADAGAKNKVCWHQDVTSQQYLLPLYKIGWRTQDFKKWCCTIQRLEGFAITPMRNTIFFLSYIRNTKGYGDSPCDTYQCSLKMLRKDVASENIEKANSSIYIKW